MIRKRCLKGLRNLHAFFGAKTNNGTSSINITKTMNPPLPDGLPPLPPIPQGFSRWSYEGIGYKYDDQEYHHPFATTPVSWQHEDFGQWFVSSDEEFPGGDKDWHYIMARSAIPLPEEDANTEGVFDHVADMDNSIFRITWRDGRYTVNLHGYNGGEVVPAGIARRVVKRLQAKLAGERSSLAESRAEVERLSRELGKMENDGTQTRASISALREENKRLREWQPIETAPKDREKIDLLVHGERKPDCSWNGYQWGYWTTNSDKEPFFCCFKPDDLGITHWFRVPAAPENQGEGGEG